MTSSDGTSRLTIQSSTGPVYFRDCVFTGCADTAIVFRGSQDNPIGFTSCRIESCAVGFATTSDEPTLELTDCVVRDVGDGLSLTAPYASHLAPAVSVTGMSFERVGTALRSVGPWRYDVVRSSITDCSGPAVNVQTREARFTRLVVQRAAAGVLVEGVPSFTNSPHVFTGFLADSCDIRDVNGDALRVDAAPATASGRVRVRYSTISNADGAGVRLTARGATVLGTLVSNTGGDGIVLQQLAPATPDSIVGNTVALATGRGIAIERDSGVLASTALVSNNIAVFSGDAGISVGAFATATVQQNDSWQNALGDFANVAAPLVSNLSVNPAFCAVSTGDYTLQSGSPCAPSGMYGLIGALPVACAASPVGVTPRSPALSLAVGPNPSLGGVRFALPKREDAGVIEVLDLAGRRVWSQEVAPHAESVEWSGRANGARASGVFFARLTQGGTRVTQRFVLMR